MIDRSIDDVWIGIDIGTQSVRAMAVAGNGQLLGSGAAKLASVRVSFSHEQNPQELWKATAEACRAAMRDVPADRVRGVAVDGTSGSILQVDAAGKPLTPIVMYDDVRGAAYVERVNRAGESAWRSLGYRMQATWALPKLLALLDNRPNAPAGSRVIHQSDFVNQQLVGAAVPTDSSNALKTGYDLLRGAWPMEVFAALGIPENVLPDVVRPGTPIGVVSAAAAAETNIPVGTPVIAGMTDGCAAQIGAGAVRVGQWNSVLGTTLVLKGVTKDLVPDPNGVVYSHRSPDGHWLPGGASNVGAAALVQPFMGSNLMTLAAEAASREGSDVIVYPLISRGERFPFVSSEATSFTLGQPFDEIDLFGAILQGVAFVERLCFDYLSMLHFPTEGDLSLTGGGARNPYWNQLRADILDRQVRIPDNAEAALGMAILAASAGEHLADAAAHMVRVNERIDPRGRSTRVLLAQYLKLVDELHRRGWIDRNLKDHAYRRAGR